MSRPRLLFISPRSLFPPDQGGKIRTGNILRHMKGGALEIILASPAPADHARFAADINAVCDRFVHWPEQPPSTLRRVAALASALPVAAATDRSAVGSRVIAGILAEKPEIVGLNKIDALDEDAIKEKLAALKRSARRKGAKVKVLALSGAAGIGVDAVLEALWTEIAAKRAAPEEEDAA